MHENSASHVQKESSRRKTGTMTDFLKEDIERPMAPPILVLLQDQIIDETCWTTWDYVGNGYKIRI